MKKNTTGSGVTSLQYVDDGKKEQAQFLRRCATPAEKKLWEAIRNRQAGGLKFRRQQVIDGFIADFFCEEARLVIEVDGGIHENPEQEKIDRHRENVFAARGIYTLRIGNAAILNNLPATLEQILKMVKMSR